MNTKNNPHKLLTKKKNSVVGLIPPEQLEDEARIVRVDFYTTSSAKSVLYYILLVLSVGIITLFSKWVPKIRVMISYLAGSPKNAEYLAIHCIDGTVDYINVYKKEFCIDGVTKLCRMFKYRLYTFYYDSITNCFKPIQFVIKNKTFTQIRKEMSHGFSTNEAYNQRLSTYGKNSTSLEEKSNFEIVFHEMLSPLYIFQLFAIIYFYIVEYTTNASYILGVSSITLAITFYKIKQNYKKLREKAFYATNVSVYRSPEEVAAKNQEIIVKMVPKIISSVWLVPGDLIEIPSNKKMPCDIILISGTCIMNESMFTGDSTPIIKHQLPESDKIFDANTDSQYILLSGTECLEARKASPREPVLGIVLRTGFDTMKGRLIRSFVYSKPEDFPFYKDCLKYVGAMACVAAICFGVNVSFLVEQRQSPSALLRAFLDIITTTVPPSLPTVVALVTTFASIRLERKDIITKSEVKINVAGKVNMMCFDKTGTITKSSQDIYGVIPVKQREYNKAEFDTLIQKQIHSGLDSINQKTFKHEMLELMATCHNLTYVKKKLTGDPLEVKMFEAIGWKYIDSAGRSSMDFRIATLIPPKEYSSGYYDSNSTVIVLKRFEFSSKLKRMSVITRDNTEGKQRVYAKGAPEMILSLCKPETIPSDFNKVLESYTQSGFRVIACATKILETNVLTNGELDREPFEIGLKFLGLLIFENKTKEISPSIIKNLKEANIQTLMMTGDNPLTSIFIARDCGIIEQNQRVALATLVPSEDVPENKQLEWKFIDSIEVDSPVEIAHLKDQVELTVKTHRSYLEEETLLQGKAIEAIRKDPDLIVAMTGEAFNYFASSSETSCSHLELVLRRCKIFSRQSPDDKATVIEKLRKLSYIVGMCGDGANDCPALKAANVGLSLSEDEASLAAPFTSKIIDISPVDDLLRVGRATLVTSFHCFRYMSMYALVQAFSSVLMTSRSSYTPTPCWLYQELFITIPATVSISLTAPTSKLSTEEPASRLLSFPILLGMFGQSGIQAAAQIIAASVLQEQDWYVSPTDLNNQLYQLTGDYNSVAPTYDASVLFVVANIQLICAFLNFYIGKPFRQPPYKNIIFTVLISASSIMSIIFVLVPMPSTYDSFKIKEVPQSFKWIIFGIVVANSFVTICYEKIVVPFVVSLVHKIPKKRKQSNKKAKILLPN